MSWEPCSSSFSSWSCSAGSDPETQHVEISNDSHAGFDSDLKDILPRLRVYALSLTRDRDRADDLVQQTAVKALAGRKSFRPGTNFRGWLFRIQRNEFISGLRRVRPTVCFDDTRTNTLSHPPHQESGLVMREFMGAFRQLAPGTRQALLLAAVEGHSYKQIATPAGISVGTVKSRISRGRAALQQMLADKSPGVRSPALPVPKTLKSRCRMAASQTVAPFFLDVLGPRDLAIRRAGQETARQRIQHLQAAAGDRALEPSRRNARSERSIRPRSRPSTMKTSRERRSASGQAAI